MATFSEESAEIRLAREIMNFIRSQGFNFTAGQLTPADGNCFIHAVLQQLNRPSIAGDFVQPSRGFWSPLNSSISDSPVSHQQETTP